jgi:hypothetical protein
VLQKSKRRLCVADAVRAFAFAALAALLVSLLPPSTLISMT